MSILIPTFENIVDKLSERLNEIETEIKNYIVLTDNDTKATNFYWKYIKGKSLIWIASKLNYGYIRQIHSKIMKKLF